MFTTNGTLNETLNLFNQKSPIDCYKLNMVAVYCICVLILSVIFNTALLLMFAKYKTLRTNLNLFIITLTLFNLFGSVIQFFFVIPSNFYCRFVQTIFI